MVHEPIKIILVWCFLFRFLKIPTTSGEIGKWKPGYIVPRPLPEDIMVDTVNYIALSLLHAHSENNENNIAISPYGATSVLVAVTEGVKGIALEEILRSTFLPFDMTVTRIGLRDMHRHLKSYFVPQEGFLAGLTFNHENITLKPSYVDTIKFYGYDVKSFNKGIYSEPNPTTMTSTQSTGETSSKMTTTIVSTESTAMESTTPASTESTKGGSSEMTTTTVSSESTAESTAESTEGSSSEMMTTMNTESTAGSTMESTSFASTESTEKSSSEMMTTMSTETTAESTTESTTSVSTESTEGSSSEMMTTMSTETTAEGTTESTTSVSTESTEGSSSEMMTTMSTETTAEGTTESTTSVSTESTQGSSSEMTTKDDNIFGNITMETTTSASTASTEGNMLEMATVSSTQSTGENGGRGGLGIKAQPLTTKLARQDNTDLSVTSMRKPTTNIKPGSLTSLITDKTVGTTKKITTKRQVLSTSGLPITRTFITPAATYAEKTLHSTKHYSTVVFTDDIITKNNTFTASPLILIYSTPTEKEAISTVIKKSSTEALTTTQKLNLTPLQTTLKTLSIIRSTSPFITKKQTLSVTATETSTSLSSESSSTKATTARFNLKKLSSTDTTVPFSTLPSTVFIENDISETTFPTTQSTYPKLSLTTHSGHGEVTSYDYYTTTDTFPLNKPSRKIKTNVLATDTTEPNMILQNNGTVNKNRHERKLERQQSSILTSSYRGSKAQGVKLSLVAKVTNTFDTKTLNKYVPSNKQMEINKDSFIDQQKIERFEEHGLNNSFISSLIKRQTANNVRRRQIRSIIDFLIARYYDTHPTYSSVTYGTGYEPPPPTSFLVNTKFREPNIKFLTYDTVLPFRYISRLNSLAITFPLDNTKFYLLLVLPTNEMGLENLITNIMSTTLKQIVYSLQPTRVKAIIPNFTLKGAVTLTPTLQKLGIRQIFEPGRADFSRMTDDKDVYVTNIEQAVTITISDFINPGTSINDNHKFRRRGPVQFTADHPFLYFVMDSEIHVSLMVGKIVNPSNSRIR